MFGERQKGLVRVLCISSAAVITAGMVRALARNRRRAWARKLRKAELHIHLDGSLRESTFLELYAALPPENFQDANGEKDPYGFSKNNNIRFETVDDIKRHLEFKKGMKLKRCLASFAFTLRLLQSASSLRRVARELCEDLAADGCCYGEIRYCPSLHVEQGLTREEVVKAVGAGLRDFHSSSQFQFRQILTALRDLGSEEAIKVAELAARCRQNSQQELVVGFDLAGNEAAHPPEQFKDAFDIARAAGLGLTVHAGEGDDKQSAQNIIKAIEVLKVQRIGHCVAAKYDSEALAAVRHAGVIVETCPTSNCHTCPAIRSISASAAATLIHSGIRCIPCTDNALLSATSTSGEYALLREHTNLSVKELEEMARCSIKDAAFDYSSD